MRDTPNEERRRAYTEMSRILDAANTEFDGLVRLSDTMQSATAAMSKSGNTLLDTTHEVRRVAQRTNDPVAGDAGRELETATLTLRVAALRFFLFKDAASATDFGRLHDAMGKSL